MKSKGRENPPAQADAVVRIVILGGGFGGIYTARRLARLLPASRYRLTLVDRNNFFLFTPMLHEVAASDLDATHIVNPIRKLLPSGALFVGEVERIDLERHFVTARHSQSDHVHDLPYEHLVLALGGVTNFFDLEDVERRSFPIRTLGDALALRNRLIDVLDEADFECSAAERDTLLGFVVVGGGFAGVETAAAVNDFLRESIGFYPHLDESMLRVTLVHAGSGLLPELSPGLGTYARQKLEERGMEVLLDRRVTGSDEHVVRLDDGAHVPAGTIVWAAGLGANPRLADLPCSDDGGRIPVGPDLAVSGWPGVWALGDCARVPDLRNGGYCPPTAQHALRQAKVLADNIAADVLARDRRTFEYRSPGQLASIGRRSGVARLGPWTLSGFPAWWLWRSVYVAKLPRIERKIRVALDWTLDLFFSKDLTRVPTEPSTVMRRER